MRLAYIIDQDWSFIFEGPRAEFREGARFEHYEVDEVPDAPEDPPRPFDYCDEEYRSKSSEDQWILLGYYVWNPQSNDICQFQIRT
jgi:hypothetical protein